ncbi:la-related protein 1B-like [Apium graveolens]|uniref:la-related protein 1B-like n=1 Tax=Apium graveolens TaxID=4045 RepID=UPI003D7A6CD2
MAADLTTTTPSSPKSPNFHRKLLPSPWTQVVRGEPDLATSLPPDLIMNPPAVTAAADEISDFSNDNVAKKSVWKSVNDVVETGTVMGGVAWPTISESTRASPKVSPSFSKPLPDGLISLPQEPVISPVPRKEVTANGHHSSNHTHKQNHRKKNNRKNGNAGVGSGQGSGQGNFSRPPGPPPPPPPPPFPIPFGNLPPPGMELPIREPSPFLGNNLDTRPIGGGVGYHPNDHSSQRHPSRRSNFGPRPRGDGGYNNGYGIRRDQDRDWNASGRDMHINPMVPPPPPPPPRGLTRPPLPGPMPFIPSRHVRPFGNPMPFDMVPPFLYVPPMPPDSYRGVPLVLPPPPHLYFPVIDPNLRILLLNQIDYYFSDANLVKDDFLRSNMDDQGWVSINLIANFRRVSKLTTDVQLILDTLAASTVVEVQGDKIRRRENWSKWIPSVGQASPDIGLQSQSPSTDVMLATSIQEVQLDKVTSNNVTSTDKTVEHSDAEPRRVTSSDEPITQSESVEGLILAETSSEGCT